MPLGSSPSLGLGEYLTLWTIIAIGAVALLGFIIGGVAFGGTVLFFIAAAVAVLVIYLIISRVWRWALHGSISAGGDA